MARWWTSVGPCATGGPESLTPDSAWTDIVYLAPNADFSQAWEIGRFTYTSGLNAGRTYTRTERFRLAEHIQGVYRFYVKTDALGQVPETKENNNLTGAVDGTVVALTPRPDLQVTSFQAPAMVTSGGVVDVEFTVTNRGPVRTPTGGSRWLDGVYLSLDNKWDGGDRLLGDLSNGSALAAGESYTTRGNFQIPLGYGGNFYLIIAADRAGSVDEFPQEANNIIARPLAVDVTPVPPPDLVVTQVNAATEAFDATTITVHYQVMNRGAGITYPAGWHDSVWLTRAQDRPDSQRGDVLLGTFWHEGVLEVNEAYLNDVLVTLPKHISGQFFLTVWTDAYDRVYEQSFDINLNPDAPHDFQGSNFKARPLTVLYTPPADLEVMQVTAPASAQGGTQVTISWTVANNGQNATDREQWADAIYVSNVDKLHAGQGTEWLVFGVPHYGKLDPGQQYTQEATFTLPPAAEGARIFVETNADPSILMTDQELLLHEVGLIIERADAATTEKPLEDLSRREILEILLGPGPEVVFEGPWTTNNAKAANCRVLGLKPDLAVTRVSYDGPAFSGDPIQVSWTVTNIGDDATWSGTMRWFDYVYLSPDPVFDLSRASLIGKVVHAANQPLASGESYTAKVTLNLPEGIEGKKYIHVFCDRDPGLESGSRQLDEPVAAAYPDWPEYYLGRVWEAGQKSNNYNSILLPVTYREADLRVTSILPLPANVESGMLLPVTWTVTNQGGAPPASIAGSIASISPWTPRSMSMTSCWARFGTKAWSMRAEPTP